MLVLGAGAIACFLIELIKFGIRRWQKNDDYSFSPLFYELSLPFFTALAGYVLSLVGWAEVGAYTGEMLLQWFLAVLVALGTYALTVKPFKDSVKSYKDEKAASG